LGFQSSDRPIVLLFALDRESAPLRRRLGRATTRPDAPCPASLYHNSGLLLLETGVGVRRTATALRWLRQAGIEPGLIVSCGYSGALCDELNVGDVVIASLTALPTALAHRANGRIHCTDRMIADPDEKRRLGREQNAQAVDMESAAVAEYCAEYNIPCAAVRVISDTVSTRLSPQLLGLLSAGRAPLYRILAALIRSPRLLPELLRLARDTRLASQCLADALEPLLANRCRRGIKAA